MRFCWIGLMPGSLAVRLVGLFLPVPQLTPFVLFLPPCVQHWPRKSAVQIGGIYEDANVDCLGIGSVGSDHDRPVRCSPRDRLAGKQVERDRPSRTGIGDRHNSAIAATPASERD